MRRYTFYLAVALLAFGIGSFVVYQFYLKPEPKVAETSGTDIFMQRFDDVRVEIKKRALERSSKTQISVEKKTFTCGNKILSVVIDDLRRDKIFNEDFENYLEESDSSDCRSMLFIEQFVDLNSDGINEFIVRGNSSLLCGGTGNCQTWIYKKSGSSYKKLLETSGEYLLIKKTSTNSYKDIFVKDHDSAYSSYQMTFKFDRNKYKESKCLYVEDLLTNQKYITTCAEKLGKYQR